VRDVSADRLIQKTISTRMRESPEGCADENTMAAYLEGNLSPQETAAFEDHVSECASCQEILALSMKLQADEATSQTTAEQGTGKRTLFRFSIPIPVLGAVCAVIVLSVVLFRIANQSGGDLHKTQTTELHPAAQKAETAAPIMPVESPMAAKGGLAPEEPKFKRGLTENKATESGYISRQAAMEPYRPSALPAIENEPAAVADASAAKTASALPPPGIQKPDVALEVSAQKLAAARAHSAKEKSAELQSPAAASDKMEVSHENKANEPEFVSRSAAVESYRAAALPATANEPAVVAETSSVKMTAVGASSVSQNSAEIRSSKGALDKTGINLQSISALNMVPPKEILFALKDGRSRLQTSKSKRIGDKVLYLSSGFWVDPQCVEHRDEPIIEILPAASEHKSILAKYPELRDLLPAVIYWNNRIYLLR
jgi:hypothetical protein